MPAIAGKDFLERSWCRFRNRSSGISRGSFAALAVRDRATAAMNFAVTVRSWGGESRILDELGKTPLPILVAFASGGD
jgi:hypothetical protein